MFLNQFLTALFQAHIAVSPIPAPPSPLLAPTDVDEVLSYQCAQSIISLVAPAEQIGPLFAQGQLTFLSLEASDASPLLIVNAGNGNFLIPLTTKGVNRIRFALPTSDGQQKTFFLSYLHGGALRSRYFEYSEELPPEGHDELDYVWMTPHRAEGLLPHYDYAIHETADATVKALTEGRLTHTNIVPHKVENCEHLARRSARLASDLQRNLDLLDMMLVGQQPVAANPQRLPASVSAKAWPGVH
jgi:hypothetical protein